MKRLLYGAVLAVVLLVAAPVPAAAAAAGSAATATTAVAKTEQPLIPESDAGRYPTSHYDIGYDAGAWNNIQRKFFGLLTELCFSVVRWLVGLGLWLVRWAYGFGIANALGDPAARIAAAYQAELIGPVGLRHAALFAAVAWAGYQGLRGRLQMAFGELLITALVGVLGAFVLASPRAYLDGTLDTTHRVSGAFLALGTSSSVPSDAPSSDAVLRPLAQHLHAAFVEQPYDVLAWGRVLDGECARVRDEILATGPHGTDDGPREAMEAAGCDEEADFNHDPTADRLGGALLTALATALVVALLALIAVTLLVAQVMAVLLFAVAPFAFVGGLLPGGGREVLWRWLAALARTFVAVVGMSFVLSLLLLVVDGLLAASAGQSLTERFALLVLVTVGMFIVRKRVVASGAQLAERFGQRLHASRSGGRAAGWGAPAAVGGISGFALGNALRESAGDVPGGWGYRMQYLGRHPYYRTSRRLRQGAYARALPSGAASGGVRGALARAGHRVGMTPPARVAGGAASVAAGGAALAYKATLGLPVHGPRAYRAAADAVRSRQTELRVASRAYRAEYLGNLSRLRARLPSS